MDQGAPLPDETIIRPKVFGIGFQKTGTKSLATALRRLGYRVTGPNAFLNPRIGEIYKSLTAELSAQYDGFQDNPWPLVYREMDRQWPDARFILTLRDPDSWIRSQKTHFAKGSTPMRELIYGVGAGNPNGNEDLYLRRYQMHNLAVRTYFQDRPGKLLELDITAGQGWDRLCPFLDLPMPDRSFPQRNTAQRRKRLARLAEKRARAAKRAAKKAEESGS